MDGASVMVSQHNGVTGQVRIDNPHCVALHCVNHRLHLAVSKAASNPNVPAVCMLSGIVSTIYIHVNNSPNRLAKFKQIADMLTLVDQDADEGSEHESVCYRYLKFKKVMIRYQ